MSEATIPQMTEMALPRFQNTARNNPPSKAPLVSPRSLKAMSRTKVTSRLRYATKIKAAAQKMVEILLKLRKYASDFRGNIFFTKSMVETDASDVSAELTED